MNPPSEEPLPQPPADHSLAPPPPPPPSQQQPEQPPMGAAPAAAAVAPPAPPRSDSGMRLVAGVATAVILATGGGIAIGWNLARVLSDHSNVAAQIHTVAPQSPAPGTSAQNAPDKVIPAVVDINTVVQTSNGKGEAAGTGEILDSTGDVLTNNHVVEGAISVSVAVQGHSGTYKADVVGVDPKDDVAVIHIENVSGLPTVTLADSSGLQVGDAVYAIGNALGQGGTPRVTQGHVTALDQTITASEGGSNSETLNGMIQSDAEISPGDSGGALVNAAGQMVGMITAGEATSFRTTSSPVGYAIPSSTAADVANRILNGQSGNGIVIGPVGYLGISVNDSGVVVGFQPNSPAEAAGMTTGSVITALDGTSIDSPQTLRDALDQHKPGDHVTVTWDDNGTSHTATVTLISGPAV